MKQKAIQVPGFESVTHFSDKARNLNAIIAIHSTKRGPSLGGCRMHAYPNMEEALLDATRLAQGMTYKNVLADLPHGGGKAVIIGDPKTEKTPDLLRAFGDAVESLQGDYITGEDVGMKAADLLLIAERTKFATGVPKKGVGGDPSPFTALGVYNGMRAAAEVSFGNKDLSGLQIAVSGLGNVGYELCRLVHAASAHLFVSDIDTEKVERAKTEFGATPIAPSMFMAAEVDILAPCALGGAVNPQTVDRITAPIIAGSANNQLSDPSMGVRLHKKGILYAPDYVINSGGVISVAYEFAGTWTRDEVSAKAEIIGARLGEIFRQAKLLGAPTSEIADRMAESLLNGVVPTGVPSIAAE